MQMERGLIEKGGMALVTKAKTDALALLHLLLDLESFLELLLQVSGHLPSNHTIDRRIGVGMC